MFSKARLLLICCIAVFAIFWPMPSATFCQDSGIVIDQSKADRGKAVYLYSLGRFTTWPADLLGEEFLISIVGKSGVVVTPHKISRKKNIDGKKIRIRQYENSDKEDPRCHMLFISGSVPHERQKELIKLILKHPILVVTEGEIRRKGAAINLILKGENVKFELDIDTIQQKKSRNGCKAASSRTENVFKPFRKTLTHVFFQI